MCLVCLVSSIGENVEQVGFCEIMGNYSSFFTRKWVVIEPLKFLSCMNDSCLGYCILEG